MSIEFQFFFITEFYFIFIHFLITRDNLGGRDKLLLNTESLSFIHPQKKQMITKGWIPSTRHGIVFKIRIVMFLAI